MFKDKRRIILAKIEIPIEFLPDGSHINHNDRACVNFYRCPLLPPQQNYDDVDFGEILEDLLSEGIPQDLVDDENPIFIMKEPEIELDAELEEEKVLEEVEETASPIEKEPDEYFIQKSEIPTSLRQPSKNTSFKCHVSKGKKSMTYKKYGP